MFGEQRIRTLLGSADPSRAMTIGPPRVSARDLIGRAETTVPPMGRRHGRTSRRLVIAAGAAAVAAGGTAVVYAVATATSNERSSDRQGGTRAGGTVLVPIAYQYGADAQPAGAKLRELADRLVDAPYERHTGRYTYHHFKTWGDPLMSFGPYVLGYVTEQEVWDAADGTGRQSTRQLEPEYPDQQSRDYWQHELKTGAISGTSAPDTMPVPPFDIPPLPADQAQLSELLKVQYGAASVSKEVGTVYGRYAVPRQIRAQILQVVADVPGFLWRGQVTDRAGRNGLAITFDDGGHAQQHLLIFDPETGHLLADELLTLSPKRISTYQLILGTDRTEQLG